MTQQNAALVEESAAAATSINEQANQLIDVVSVFKLNAGESTSRPTPRPASSPRPAAPPAAAKKPAPKVQASLNKPRPAPAPKAAIGNSSTSAQKTSSSAPSSQTPDGDWDTF